MKATKLMNLYIDQLWPNEMYQYMLEYIRNSNLQKVSQTIHNAFN